MRYLFLSFFLVSTLPNFSMPIQETYYLTNLQVVNVIEGTVESKNILIKEGIISSLKPISEKLIQGVQTFDLDGKFIIPGLWDMHTHIHHQKDIALDLLLTHGVTGIRDMGGDFEAEQKLREKLRKSIIKGPRIKFSSPILEGKRWLEWASQSSESSLAKNRLGISDPEVARQLVTSLKNLPIDHIKLRTTENKVTYLEIIRTAEAMGLKLYGHLQAYPNNIIEASNLGQDSFEHSFFLAMKDQVKSERQKTYRALVKNNSYITPTLITDEQIRLPSFSSQMLRLSNIDSSEIAKLTHPQVLVDWRESQLSKFREGHLDWKKIIPKNRAIAREMLQAGVKFIAGSDFVPFMLPGESLHSELELMVKILGMTQLQALQTATINAATLMGIEKSYGSIEEGKKADLVVLDKNPLLNISAVKQVFAVINAGEYYNSEKLAALRENVALRVALLKTNFIAKPDHGLIKLLQRRTQILKKLTGRKLIEDELVSIVDLIERAENFNKVEENDINELAYNLATDGHLSVAESLFIFNIRTFPKSWNAYDSLAEYYLKTEVFDKSVENYQMALKLNPQKTDGEKRQYQFQKRIVTEKGKYN